MGRTCYYSAYQSGYASQVNEHYEFQKAVIVVMVHLELPVYVEVLYRLVIMLGVYIPDGRFLIHISNMVYTPFVVPVDVG